MNMRQSSLAVLRQARDLLYQVIGDQTIPADVRDATERTIVTLAEAIERLNADYQERYHKK